jgi:cytochrome c biogenesis protein CcmG, thiol:disulfide interchange protein DsbE
VHRRLLVVLCACALAACSTGGGGFSSGGGVVDASFERLDGSTASFTDYRGKPVVVNFFSSTCVPCVTEMPALEQVHQELGAKVSFLGLNVQDTVEAARSFLDTVRVTWDIGRDPTGSILQSEAGGIGLPTTLLIDREGMIVFKHLGALNVEQLRQALADNHFT